MAISIPQDASGAAISTGQGQGYAQVFNKSSFDPVAFTANLNKEREAKRQKDIDAEIALRAKNKKFLADLPTTDKYNEWNKDEINKITNDAELKLAEAMAKGIDLEGSLEGLKIVRDLKNGLALKGGQGQAITKAVDEYTGLVSKDPGKYDAEELATWLKGLDKIQTLDGRAKYVATTSPFEEKPMEFLDVLADIGKIIPTYIKEKGLQTIEKWDDKIVEDISQSYLRDLGPEEVDKMYQKGLRDGLWTSVQGMYDKTTEEMKKRGPYKETYTNPSGGGGVSVSVGGYRVPEKISAQGRSRWDTLKGGVDEVSISYNSKDVPPFEVEKNAGGEKIRFAPVKWFRDKDGKWMVEGKSYGRTGEERIKPDDVTVDVFEDELRKQNPESEIVMEGNKATIFKPLKTEVVPYDLNDISFKSHLEGFDLYDYEKGWNKANAGKAKQGSPAPKKGVTDVGNIFGGQ